MTQPNGSKEIVVTTGYYSTTGTETEIFNLGSMTWRSGPDFPVSTFDGFSLPYNNTFLAIGGLPNEDYFSNQIWHFNPDSYEWEMISTMVQGRSQLAAIALPESTC